MSRLVKLPIIRSLHKRYVDKHDQLLEGNRQEVLILYRKLLKIIPKTLKRHLHKQQKIEV